MSLDGGSGRSAGASRGGALLARALRDKGVERVFTLSGGFCNPALEGFMECQVPVTNCPHEQVAGHLADGHARLTRKPTVCLVGPEGFANAVPSMLEAAGERAPVIFVTGSSTMRRQGAGGFKEIDDVAIAAPLVKHSARVTDGTRIREFVDRAWQHATSGYPGPVHLSVPVDIMFSSFDDDSGDGERPWDRGARPAPRAWPDPEALARVLDIVRGSRRPVVIAGHGVWWSRAEGKLERTCRELRIPAFNVPYHAKLLPSASGSYMGLADVHQYHPSRQALEETDAAIVVGGRLDNQLNFGNPPLFPKGATLVCVNGSVEELGNNYAADEVLLSDPGAFLDALGGVGRTWGDWFDLQADRREKWVAGWERRLEADFPDAEESPGPGPCAPTPDRADGGARGAIHPMRLAIEVIQAMDDGDWLVFDGGNTHFWNEIALNVAGWRGKRLGGVLHPGSYSLLGVGVSLGISAKSVHRDRNAVVVSGDGAFLSGGLSVETAFQEGLPITVVIDNNAGLDCISQQQERLFVSGRHFATDFRDIPFHEMFRGLGGHGELVDEPEAIGPAVRRAIASGKTACVNVRTRGAISPIVAAATDRRDKASIE